MITVVEVLSRAAPSLSWPISVSESFEPCSPRFLVFREIGAKGGRVQCSISDHLTVVYRR